MGSDMALTDRLDMEEIKELAGDSNFLTTLVEKLDKTKVSTILEPV
jgi:hypothetical protein